MAIDGIKMDAVAESGRDPVSKHHIDQSDSARVRRMSGLPRGGTTEPVSRDQFLRRERRWGEKKNPCSADHEQNWQPYPVYPYSA